MAYICTVNPLMCGSIVIYIYIYNYELTGAIIILGLCPKTVTITGLLSVGEKF